MTGKKKLRRALTQEECKLLHELCKHRIDRLTKLINSAAGTMWPNIWSAEIGRIEGLFENLAGFPLDSVEE